MSDGPVIEVVRDFDGYFEGLVRRWINEKRDSGAPFKVSVVRIEATPYLADAAQCYSLDGRLAIRFYSALRTGFGYLSDEDVKSIKERL